MHAQKLLRGQDVVLNRASVDSMNQKIRNKLDKAKYKHDSSLIIKHLSDYQKDSNVLDCSVYGKAIKNCSILNEDILCIKIMDMLLQQISEKLHYSNLNNIVFSVFFNAMSKANKPLIAYKYFKIMTTDLKIKPNEIIFATLIKSCRYQGDYELAEKYWKLMENTYKIKPNLFLFTEMISVYSNGNQPNKAIQTFNQCLLSFNDNDNNINKSDDMLPLFGAYLNIFSRIGDLKGMNDAIKLISKYHHTINVIMYADLMRGCIIARKPNKAIEFYKMMINNGLKPTETALNLKGIALSTIVRSDDKLDFDNKLNIYKELLQHNETEYIKYGVKLSGIARNSELTTIISLYHNVNPMKIIQSFEQMIDNKSIDYRIIGENNNIIDLHCFQHLTVQFILRYVIGFKLKEFDLMRNNGLYIIVGKGIHNNKSGINKKYSIKQFVLDELKTFEPEIICKECENNAGMLFIANNELLPYLTNTNNYATIKLRNPSNDWYLDDPRK